MTCNGRGWRRRKRKVVSGCCSLRGPIGSDAMRLYSAKHLDEGALGEGDGFVGRSTQRPRASRMSAQSDARSPVLYRPETRQAVLPTERR